MMGGGNHIYIFLFVYFREARRQPHHMPNDESGGATAPQINLQVGPHSKSSPIATRGPRKPLPGHGHRLHPHLAAGLAEWTTHNSEDFSSCTLNQELPFE